MLSPHRAAGALFTGALFIRALFTGALFSRVRLARVLIALGLGTLCASGGLAQERPPVKIIRKITIRGLKRLSEPSVAARMKIRIGQAYDQLAADTETGLLYQMGEFTHVYDPEVRDFEDGVEVIYRVDEKPRIAKVKLVIRDTPSGKPSLSQKDLLDGIATKADGRLSDYQLKVDADKLLQLYREKGYCFCDVASQVKETPAGMEVSFLINEGTRVRIREIDFHGNRSIDSGALLSVMETKPKDVLFFGLINPGYYNLEVLDRDLSQVTKYYQSKGFFEARVSLDSISLDPSVERMRISIRIDEGPRYTFRGYSFEGNRVFATAILSPLVRALPGQPYDEERIQDDRREIMKYYRDRAYIYARVEPVPEWTQEGTEVRVRFKIEEGNEIYIEHVKIRKVERKGNELAVVPGLRTQDRVIRRELEFYPGEMVRQSRVDKSRSNLARLQIFKDIHIKYEPGSSPEKNDVAIDIEEDETTGQLIIGFGVTQGFGIIGNFSILKRNFDIADVPDSIYDLPEHFTGAGQTLNLRIQPGTQFSSYRATFVEPYILETRNSLSLTAQLNRIIRDDFTEDRASFIPRIGHAFDFDRDLIFSFGARVENVKIGDLAVTAPPDAFAVEGYTTIVAVSAGLSYDKTLIDRWEGPFQGHKESLVYEYGGEPLGGQVDFQRVDGTLELYFPLYVHEENQLHHVISLYSRAGLIEPHHGQEDIPIFERYFLGGPQTVRGFEFRGLGPRYGKDPTGGTAQWYGNIEYVFPIFQKFLRGVVFLDYGELSPDLDSFEFSQMRLSAGAGVRINFPFLGGQPLPIGLFLGDAFKREPEDKVRVFNFTIGVPF